MPKEVRWLLDSKIILIDSDEMLDVTLEDIHEISETIQDFFKQSDAPLVHVILSEERVRSLPKSLKAFSEVANFMRHPKMGWLLVYGNDNGFIKFMSAVVTGMAQVRHRRFNSRKECLEFLISVDSTLPTVEEMLKH